MHKSKIKPILFNLHIFCFHGTCLKLIKINYFNSLPRFVQHKVESPNFEEKLLELLTKILQYFVVRKFRYCIFLEFCYFPFNMILIMF